MGVVKVALLTSNFPPEIHAGTEMVVVALGHALRRRGVDLVVVTSSEKVHSGQDLRVEDYEGMRVLRAFKHLDEWDQNRLDRPRLVELAAKALAAEKPDVLHVHSFSQFGTGIAQRARELRIATAMTFHDVWATCPRFFRSPPEGHGIVCPTGSEREVCVRCCNLELRHPDLDVVRAAVHGRDASIRREVAAMQQLSAPTRTAARIVRENLPTDRPVEVIPHGLLRPLPAEERAAAPRADEKLRIGTYGNLVEPKGVLELVRAVADLDCELHLAGAFLDAKFEALVRSECAELGVDLHYHGAYTQHMPHPALRLHLAVFPSKCQETYGLVVDESLARGVPVVVSDNGALVERAALGGAVVTPVLGLREAVHGVARNRDVLERLRRAIPQDMGSIEGAAEQYVAMYRRAMEER